MCRITIIMLCALTLSGLKADPILSNSEHQMAYILKGCSLRKRPYEDASWEICKLFVL